MPIVLDISEKEVETLGLKEGSRLALLDGRDDAALAILTSEFHAVFLQSLPRLLMRNSDLVEDIYTPDLVKEAVQVLGDDDIAHPSVVYLHTRVQNRYIGGKIQAIQTPPHYDYVDLRCTSYSGIADFSELSLYFRHTIRTPCTFCQAGVEESYRVPDAKSHAPGSS